MYQANWDMLYVKKLFTFSLLFIVAFFQPYCTVQTRVI